MDSSNFSLTDPPLTESSDEILNYQIFEKLAEGSFGEVYKIKIFKNSSQFNAALKIIRSKSNMGINSYLELYVMKHIHSKFISSALNIAISIYGTINIIQEYAYSDAANLIKTKKYVLDDFNLKKWSWQIICAISHLHSKGILHCDIKARNILCFKSDEHRTKQTMLSNTNIKLTDFGLSVLIFNEIIGTKNYNCSYTVTHRPPEVFENKTFSYSADMWALGCTLYELAYGCLLFPAENTLYHINSFFENKLYEIKYTSSRSQFNELLFLLINPVPELRITIWQIINHPYFDSIRNRDDLPDNLFYPVFRFPLLTDKFNKIISQLNKYTRNIHTINYAIFLFNKSGIISLELALIIAQKILYGIIPDDFPKIDFTMLQHEINLCTSLKYDIYPNFFL